MAHASDLSTVIMCHPSRRAGAERILGECAPLAARIVEDPEPAGVPSPLRTAKVAWAAVADGASHHLVVQDDVHLRPGFAEHVRTLLERHPGCAVSLGVLWVSPYNSYRVRQAAVGGYPAVRLAPWEWVPSLGLALPADTARELADFLRGFPDVTRDDDEHIAVFCTERGIPVIAPVPHLLDHSTRPSVAGNDHHGVRLAVACVDEPVGTGYWDGPTLDAGTLDSGLGYAVELTGSRCHLRIRRSREREAAEQPFTWPWRPWSQLVGVAEAEISAAAAETAGPPAGLPAGLAAEVWAAGYLLGALSPARAAEPDPARRVVRDAAGAQALRSWIRAGLRPDDQAALGEQGCAAAAAWCHRAVAAGTSSRTGETSRTDESSWTDESSRTDETSRTEETSRPTAAPHPTGVPLPTGASPARPEATTPQIPADLAHMIRREARTLLQPAPDELPDIRLEVRPCPHHPTATTDPAAVTRTLPTRWLAEHLLDTEGDATLVALACERLEPRSLVGLANLVQGGWNGVAETRAATAVRLLGSGWDEASLIAAVNAAEELFEDGTEKTVTLPAGRLGEHAGPRAADWDARCRDLVPRHVREAGL